MQLVRPARAPGTWGGDYGESPWTVAAVALKCQAQTDEMTLRQKRIRSRPRTGLGSNRGKGRPAPGAVTTVEPTLKRKARSHLIAKTRAAAFNRAWHGMRQREVRNSQIPVKEIL